MAAPRCDEPFLLDVSRRDECSAHALGPLVRATFDVPVSLRTEQFWLEPLDYAAWTSSIDDIPASRASGGG